MDRTEKIAAAVLVAFLVAVTWAVWYRCERRAEMYQRYGYDVTAADVFWGAEPPVRLMDVEGPR